MRPDICFPLPRSTLILGIACLVELVAAFAHAQSTSPSSIGLLGQRYFEVSGGQIGASDDLFDRTSVGGVRVNMPLPAFVDLNFGYTFSRATGQTTGGTLLV